MSKKTVGIVAGSVLAAVMLFTPKMGMPKDKVFTGKVLGTFKESDSNSKVTYYVLVEKDSGELKQISVVPAVAAYLKTGQRVQGRVGWMFGCQYVDGVAPPDNSPLSMDKLAAGE
jgi:hypothetical protein